LEEKMKKRKERREKERSSGVGEEVNLRA